VSPVRVLVAGCAGRMGRAVLEAVRADPELELAGGFDRSDCGETGVDLGRLIGVDDLGLAVADRIDRGLRQADALIDFTAPAASADNAHRAAEAGLAFVVGTTGFDAAQERAIAEAARAIPIVKSGNMSLGVNLLAALVEKAAAALDDRFDIEILEMHHRHKVDAPSGTALLLGAAAARGRGVDLAAKSDRVRDGAPGPRRAGDIGFAVLRGGGVVGEHEVAFASDEEILRLSHVAMDRSLFAKGAARAAKWAKGRAPGLYSMRDVLGL